MQAATEVLILCGGEGKRLRSMISDVPKPMAPIGDRPFLDFVIQSAQDQGFENFCLLTGYMHEKIEAYFQQPKFTNVNIRFSHEKVALGTGGAIFQALQGSQLNQFLVLNGDTYFGVPLSNFSQSWVPGTFKLALKKVSDPDRYGRVEIAEGGAVCSFIEKGSAVTPGDHFINGGIYIFDKEILSAVPSTVGPFISLENDVFPTLLRRNKLFAQVFTDDFVDIGIPEDYIKAQSKLPEWLSKAR